ncbi:MAG: hypothetical protein H0T62_00415 [Parachlamydiaceae bacterium]|nr:hypothetical protein [Parachlamydiaceae bacterium]
MNPRLTDADYVKTWGEVGEKLGLPEPLVASYNKVMQTEIKINESATDNQTNFNPTIITKTFLKNENFGHNLANVSILNTLNNSLSKVTQLKQEVELLKDPKTDSGELKNVESTIKNIKKISKHIDVQAKLYLKGYANVKIDGIKYKIIRFPSKNVTGKQKLYVCLGNVGGKLGEGSIKQVELGINLSKLNSGLKVVALSIDKTKTQVLEPERQNTKAEQKMVSENSMKEHNFAIHLKKLGIEGISGTRAVTTIKKDGVKQSVFVMELSFGSYSNSEHIPADKKIANAVALFKNLTDIHNADCIHGDIGPDNIFLDSEGNALFADWGKGQTRDEYEDYNKETHPGRKTVESLSPFKQECCREMEHLGDAIISGFPEMKQDDVNFSTLEKILNNNGLKIVKNVSSKGFTAKHLRFSDIVNSDKSFRKNLTLHRKMHEISESLMDAIGKPDKNGKIKSGLRFRINNVVENKKILQSENSTETQKIHAKEELQKNLGLISGSNLNNIKELVRALKIDMHEEEEVLIGQMEIIISIVENLTVNQDEKIDDLAKLLEQTDFSSIIDHLVNTNNKSVKDYEAKINTISSFLEVFSVDSKALKECKMSDLLKIKLLTNKFTELQLPIHQLFMSEKFQKRIGRIEEELIKQTSDENIDVKSRLVVENDFAQFCSFAKETKEEEYIRLTEGAANRMMDLLRSLPTEEYNALLESKDFKPSKKLNDPIPTYTYAADIFDRVNKEKKKATELL